MSWYRSPSGAVAHADGPSQVRAFADRGWQQIDEAQARDIVAAGATLRVDRADAKGTFDDDAVNTAVRDESTTPQKRAPRKRS